MQKNETDPYITRYRKINFKCLIKDLDIRSRNLKVLEVNTEGKLFDTGLSNNSFRFDAKTRSQQKQEKKKKFRWGYIKLKSFCPAKETINKKATYGMGENICKPYAWLEVDIQNI